MRASPSSLATTTADDASLRFGTGDFMIAMVVRVELPTGWTVAGAVRVPMLDAPAGAVRLPLPALAPGVQIDQANVVRLHIARGGDVTNGADFADGDTQCMPSLRHSSQPLLRGRTGRTTISPSLPCIGLPARRASRLNILEALQYE